MGQCLQNTCKKLLAAMALGGMNCAYADHPGVGFGAGTAGPITAISASTLPKGKWAFGLRYDYTAFDEYSEERLIQFAQRGLDVHSVGALGVGALGISYGLAEDFTLGIRLPYVSRSDVRSAHEEAPGVFEVHDAGDSTGLGDGAVMLQYRFWKGGRDDPEVALLAGVNAPTGVTGNHGFEAEHQPGTDTWQPMIGLAWTRQGEWCFDASLLYIGARAGVDDVDVGDRLSYSLGLAHRPGGEHRHSQDSEPHADLNWDLVLELNGEYQQRQEIAGVKDENSGGNTLYLSPGTRLIVNNHWSVFAQVGYPLLQDPNGEQHEANWRASFGVSTVF